MGYKKHDWMNYQYKRAGEILEITIKDGGGTKLDFFRSNSVKGHRDVSRIIKGKYDIDLNPNASKSIKEEIEKEISD